MNNYDEPTINPETITSKPVVPVVPDSEFPQADPIVFGPDKKSKLPIILVAVLGALLIAGGVFGVLWFTSRNHPDTVVLEAMNKFINSKAVQAEGELTVSLPSNDFGLSGITLRLEGGSSIIPAYSNSTLTVSTTSDDFSINLKTVIVPDGAIFFQASGLTEIIRDNIPAGLVPALDQLEAEISEFDGQWYRLDIVEIVAMFGIELPAAEYDCLVDAIISLKSDSARTAFVDAYTLHPFVAMEKIEGEANGGIGYIASIENDQLTSFADYLENETTALDGFASCAPSTKGISDNLAGIDLPNLTFYISDWEHELKAVNIHYDNGIVELAGTFSLSYPDPIDTSAPTGSKPFSSFLSGFVDKLTENL